MDQIEKQIKVEIPKDQAFQQFANEFDEWWPKEYTWSQGVLEKISLGNEKNVLCTEWGPEGFRCDWGRIIKWVKNPKIKFLWQIGPNREPVPDPEKASIVEIRFEEVEQSTNIVLAHQNLQNHGNSMVSRTTKG